MKSYITAVAAAAIMAALADNLVPAKWKKHISMLTGAILLLTLISPLLKFRKIDIPKIDSKDIAAYEYDMTEEVINQFGKDVEEDVEQRLLDEFGTEANARVRVATQDGKIAGIAEISLDCKENTAIEARMKEIYGCDRVVWR